MGILDGKIAIVTGSGHGIGRGEALELAAQGAKLVINDLGGSARGEGADTSPADEVVEVIRARGGEAVANYDDVADFGGAEHLVASAYEAFGGLDILINNAGIMRDKMIVSMTEDDFDSVLRVHLKGTFAATKFACIRWRERSKAGEPVRAAVVNTVSSAGLQGNAGQANYGSAKAGIAALTLRGPGQRGGARRRDPADRRGAEGHGAEGARRVRRGGVQPPQPPELGPHGRLAGLGRGPARDGAGVPGGRVEHLAL
jgi:NAD(P)-dependent dehydrogenase (short-subunit alcohol dehydrogenase family)